ncbi:UPF0182 protein [Synergistales bacterium]|nr:UPF0182 protein [Synergistales bacterium]
MDIQDYIEKLRNLAKQANGRDDDDGEWVEGDGDNEWKPRWDYPRNGLRLPKLVFAALCVLALFAMCFTWGINFLTDMLWFDSVGLDSVLWTRVGAKASLFVIGTLLMFVFCVTNWRIALNSADDLKRKGTYHGLAISLLVIIIALILAVFSGIGLAGSWDIVLRFVNAVPFGEKDAIFGHDAGFYIFTLPFLETVRGMLLSAVFTSLAGSVMVYVACRAIRSEGTAFAVAKGARGHLAVLLSLLILLVSAGMWLARYELLYSRSGLIYGVGFTDFYFRLPALAAAVILVAAAALLPLLNLSKPRWKLSGILAAALIAVGFLSLTVLPSVVQKYIVKPNEYEREKRFLDYHINATRRAFDLDKVKAIRVTPNQSVTMADMREDADTVANIRMWDYEPLLRTYKQLQEIRSYYDFADVDIDRYWINGRNRQVMLSARELDMRQLQNPGWVNSHLEFTHGYGIVMNPVNEIEESGLPVFFMKDLPPKSNVPIKLDVPQIYYGEKPSDYALVKTNVSEFDYPAGDSNERCVYNGTGGVSISSLLRRVLFGLKFHESEIFFTDAINSDSVILYNRNIREAIYKAAPFLILDSDAYLAIIGGRAVWIQDAYTATDAYPYSAPLSAQSAIQADIAAYAGANYIRNSVKITIDAYNGDMAFYIADPNDPIIATWLRVFPKLFKPFSDASDELRAHFRYPEELFEVQSEVYKIYHMTDTNTFYNREDVWITTPQGQQRRIRPNYVTMQLANGEPPEFAMIAPFMPTGRNNLIGWMAARCDPANYGELIVYQLPKQELIFGPPQIEALIDQNTTISSQISLWSQRGSDVIRGDLLVIPVGKSLLYVEPLYLKAERGDLPELKRIILSTGGRVVWGETFDQAVTALFSEKDTVETPNVPAKAPDKTTQEPAQRSAAIDGASPQELAGEAKAAYDRAQNAIREGNWSKYGAEIKTLGDILERMSE